MKLKNRDIAEKLKDAFKKAGVELPTKQSKKIKNESGSSLKNSKRVNQKKRKYDGSLRGSKSEKCINNRAFNNRKIKNIKLNVQARNLGDGLPSSDAIRDAYGSLAKVGYQNNRAKSRSPERTYLKTRKGVQFKVNPIFSQGADGSSKTVIDERLSVTQISPGGDIEVQLVIGLDLGSSMTKVIIGDPDHNRFYAVPFCSESRNPYLIPTSISKDDANCIIIDGKDSPNVERNIKLNLMERGDDETIINLAGYIAQIVRHSMRWFLTVHADVYRGMKIFWTMALGLPVDSVRQPELEERFRIAAISGAQAAISQESISVHNLGDFVEKVREDLIRLENNGSASYFEELGGEPGVVAVVPEIAAQVVGFFRSRRWESKRPISFLVDIGAGTVDSAVFSLVDAVQGGKELAFCAFSCSVAELGVIKLHQDRIDWLHENLPDDLPQREDVVTFLEDLKNLNMGTITVPGNIDDYICHVDIVTGESNIDPDRHFKRQLSEKVYQDVLLRAKRKSERDSAWGCLRTMVCGGGGRSAFYQEFIQSLSRDSSFTFQHEVLEKPLNLDAPGLPASEFDRLSVAYGLAQGTQWEYMWPESIGEIRYQSGGRKGDFVSKEMV